MRTTAIGQDAIRMAASFLATLGLGFRVEAFESSAPIFATLNNSCKPLSGEFSGVRESLGPLKPKA